MRIREVTIEKFRSIKKASFRMKEITAVVGENNAGKTAVLRALNAVLNYEFEKDSFDRKLHQFLPRNNTHIIVTFDDIPTRDFYNDYIYDDSLMIEFSYSYSDNKKRYYVHKGREKISIDDFFMNELSKDIKYVYIPAGRTNKDVRWGEESIFRELITEYTAHYTENRDTISSYVRKATDKIHDSVLTKLEKQINELYMQNQSMDFKIGFPTGLDYTVLLENIELSLNENGLNYLLQEWGSGTKSLAVIAMHRANALLKSGSIVLGIEEPETNLHPQAQKRFIMSLRKQLHDNETQTIFTTHSTVLVDALEHEEIILVRKNNAINADLTRGFISEISQLPNDFWEKYDIEEFKHYQYFNYKNSEFFFSKYVVVGESKNDIQVFEKLVTPELGNKIADVSFLDAGGIEQIRYPYFLLKELNIPFVLVVDRDFFFEYQNDSLEESRNPINGLPFYKDIMKENVVLKDIFKTQTGIQELQAAHAKGYRKFFEYIKQYNILSMNYCLEMDLTCSTKARELYYSILNVIPANQTQRYILTTHNKAIKKIDKILKILDTIPKTSYPEAYTKIKKAIIDDINIKIGN